MVLFFCMNAFDRLSHCHTIFSCVFITLAVNVLANHEKPESCYYGQFPVEWRDAFIEVFEAHCKIKSKITYKCDRQTDANRYTRMEYRSDLIGLNVLPAYLNGYAPASPVRYSPSELLANGKFLAKKLVENWNGELCDALTNAIARLVRRCKCEVTGLYSQITLSYGDEVYVLLSYCPFIPGDESAATNAQITICSSFFTAKSDASFESTCTRAQSFSPSATYGTCTKPYSITSISAYSNNFPFSIFSAACGSLQWEKRRQKFKKSKRERVEFIPPVEYVDVSSVFIRFVQLLILCELAFYLYETAFSLAQIHVYGDFMSALTPHTFYAVTVTPLSIILAALFSYRSIQGVFAVNFTNAAEPTRKLYGFIALSCSRLVYGGVIVAAGFVLYNEVASDATKDLRAKNMAHLMHYATKDSEYMEEINRIQQVFQCCGVRTNIRVGNATYTSSDHPWNMWFATYSLDETYPNTIRELYSLPWSCCNITANVKCEHIGISRYLRTFETPTDFSDVEAALEVEELKWNPTNFDHYLSRNANAKATLYSSDCSEEMFKRLKEEVSHLRDLMFQTGMVMMGVTLLIVGVTAHLFLIVRSFSPAETAASGASKK